MADDGDEDAKDPASPDEPARSGGNRVERVRPGPGGHPREPAVKPGTAPETPPSSSDLVSDEEVDRILGQAIEVPEEDATEPTKGVVIERTVADSIELTSEAAAELRKKALSAQLRVIQQISGHASGRATATGNLSALPPIAGRLNVTLEGATAGASPEDLLRGHVEASRTPGYWEALESNSATWAGEVTVSQFWKSAAREIVEWSKEYFQEHKQGLRADPDLPPFVGKGLPRLKEKVLSEIRAGNLAKLYPDPSKSPVPDLKDLVRVRIATRYLDGVAFLADKMRRHLNAHPTMKLVDEKTQARATGYYATHLYFSYEVPFRHTTSVLVPIVCEIQIATELATTIWERTHGAYELARVAADDPGSWQWNPDDERFIAAQLAHMIHLADGLILQLRDAVAKKKGLKQ